MTLQGPRGKIHLVTSVLDRKRLSDKQAAALYRMRWGIELHFRNLKQTFGRGKLRSRNGDNAVAELEWSIFALWIIQLYAVKEQLEIDSPPERCSVAHAIGNSATQQVTPRQSPTG
jgi:IS4 transposase